MLMRLHGEPMLFIRTGAVYVFLIETSTRLDRYKVKAVFYNKYRDYIFKI